MAGGGEGEKLTVFPRKTLTPVAGEPSENNRAVFCLEMKGEKNKPKQNKKRKSLAFGWVKFAGSRSRRFD